LIAKTSYTGKVDNRPGVSVKINEKFI